MYGTAILIFVAVLFVNVFALALVVNRRFFLKDTGRKLSHLDKQLQVGRESYPHLPQTPSTVMTRSWAEMSRTYSPDEMGTPRDPSREPSENERGSLRVEKGQDQGRSGGAENQPRPNEGRGVPTTEARTVGPRKPYDHRNRTYTLRSSEIQTMVEIGTFRALATKELEEFAYGGDRKHLEADLTNLRRQGLIVERDIPQHENSSRRLVALTKEGHRLLVATKNTPKDQALYHGFTKPREAHHDADLYRLYQRGLERISREGGKYIRVILDSELKKNLYRDLGTKSCGASSAKESRIGQCFSRPI